jgi:hypothetical protein
MEILVGQLGQPQRPGVAAHPVDQDRGARRGGNRGDRGVEQRGVRHVHHQRVAGQRASHLGGDPPDGAGVPVEQDQASSLGGETTADLGADPGARTGHQRHPCRRHGFSSCQPAPGRQ